MKKLFTLLLAVAAGASALFAETVQIGDLYYNLDLDSRTATVIKSQGNKYSGDIVIPSTVNYDSTTYSVTSINSGAFQNCTSLTSVVITDSIISLGDFAFAGCSRLSSITIGKKVKSFGICVFDCGNIRSVTWNAINCDDFYFTDGMFFIVSDYSISLEIGEGVQRIPAYFCYHMKYLKTITLPASVNSIGKFAFENCQYLTDVHIESIVPPSVESTSFNKKSLIIVPCGALANYKNNMDWNSFRVHVLPLSISINNVGATSAVFEIEDKSRSGEIISCGIDGGEEFAGNIINYIGLEPNSTYSNKPFFIRTSKGDYDTIHYSFSTTALELTTLQSKTVSSSTAILLAETNMSDAETSCGFEWKRYDAPDEMAGTKVFCPVASGTMAGRLKNLKDDVYYKYRAFYQSSKGNIYYGDWQYIFTGDVSVEFDPVLYTYDAVAVTESKATLKGYAIAGAEDFTEQGFEYWADSRVTQANNAPARMLAELGEHKTVQATGIKMQVTLTDLDAGTVYKYRTYAKVGDQVCYGAEMTFTTQGVYKEEEGIDLIPATLNTTSRKLLRNGQIFILRGDKTYTLTGQEVK